VLHREDQYVVLRAKPQQSGAEQRIRSNVATIENDLIDYPPGVNLLLHRWTILQVIDSHAELKMLIDYLDGHAVSSNDLRAQRLMSLHYLPDTLPDD
jgi:hypothetical protein